MDKKIIALDIDGTIAEHDGYIASETIEMIREVEKAGHHVILASGRSYHDIVPVLREVGLSSEWLVATNGAVTFKNMSDDVTKMDYCEVSILQIIPDKHVEYFVKVAPDANFMIEVHGEGVFYQGVFDIPYTDGIPKVKTTVDAFYGRESLRFIIVDHVSREGFWREHVEFYGEGLIGAYDATDNVWVEVLHSKADKGYALEEIRKKIGVPLHNVVAVGDGHNDIGMLSWAGREGQSYAMGQAHEDVKKAANNITAGVGELGAAQVLDRIMNQ